MAAKMLGSILLALFMLAAPSARLAIAAHGFATPPSALVAQAPDCAGAGCAAPAHAHAHAIPCCGAGGCAASAAAIPGGDVISPARSRTLAAFGPSPDPWRDGVPGTPLLRPPAPRD